MKIAVLDDDPAHNELIAEVLSRAGHDLVLFERGEAALRDLRRQTFDLLLLDWNMPGLDGMEVLAQLKLIPSPPPVLLITSRSEEADIVRGLGAGADDYVVKPIQPAVLEARVAALLRRAFPSAGRETGPEIFGRYQYRPGESAIFLDHVAHELTAKELQLALTLFRSGARALSRDYLLETVWGRNPDLETRTLDAHLSRLRNKLELRPENGFRLVTIYGFGYRLEPSLGPEGQPA
jgi:DNA-binding response OmpR family regulator